VEVARLIDQMQPPGRRAMIETARASLDAERQLLQLAKQQIFESERELARIMRSYISHLENGDRKLVDAYIDRIDRIDRNAAQ